ncbi:hypothetical protein S40288_10029 [Stachybotrys chartarum IBT 40288]|nr:hypothetical protein S40288_10029 [Stachybotrys chartarum IBT 40288]
MSIDHPSTGLKPTRPEQITLEAWSQGFMVGSLVIMAGITLSNMRSGVLLHKLILIEPYWILEIYANFAYFNTDNNHLFTLTRPFEAVCRDPWWIFTAANLFYNIHYRYELSLVDIIRVSPRFGILLFCMTLSIIFIIIDLLSVTHVIPIGVINPFWKFAFVFKCLTDTIILDDFKMALDKLSRHRMTQLLPLDAFVNSQWTLDGQVIGQKQPWRVALPDEPSVEQVESVSGHSGTTVRLPPPTWPASPKRE